VIAVSPALEAEWHNHDPAAVFVMQAEEIRYGNGHGHTLCNVYLSSHHQHAVFGKSNETPKWNKRQLRQVMNPKTPFVSGITIACHTMS
jgi:hypothetical protein